MPETGVRGRPYGLGRGRGRRPAIRVHVGFRPAADVVDCTRATGKGYDARVEKVLREALEQGKL